MKDQARACAIELGEWLYWRTAGCSPEVAKMEAIITKHIAIAVREKDSEISELKDHCNLVWQLIKPFLPACPAKSRKLLDKAMEDSKKLRGEGSHRLAELSAKCQELDSRCYKESIKRLEAEARLERAKGWKPLALGQARDARKFEDKFKQSEARLERARKDIKRIKTLRTTSLTGLYQRK